VLLYHDYLLPLHVRLSYLGMSLVVVHVVAAPFGTFNRADFGVNAGLQYGFRQKVTVRIQVEAIRQD
jgi:polyisoprenoid-binding protein YceI